MIVVAVTVRVVMLLPVNETAPSRVLAPTVPAAPKVMSPVPEVIVRLLVPATVDSTGRLIVVVAPPPPKAESTVVSPKMMMLPVGFSVIAALAVRAVPPRRTVVPLNSRVESLCVPVTVRVDASSTIPPTPPAWNLAASRKSEMPTVTWPVCEAPPKTRTPVAPSAKAARSVESKASVPAAPVPTPIVVASVAPAKVSDPPPRPSFSIVSAPLKVKELARQTSVCPPRSMPLPVLSKEPVPRSIVEPPVKEVVPLESARSMPATALRPMPVAMFVLPLVRVKFPPSERAVVWSVRRPAPSATSPPPVVWTPPETVCVPGPVSVTLPASLRSSPAYEPLVCTVMERLLARLAGRLVTVLARIEKAFSGLVWP